MDVVRVNESKIRAIITDIDLFNRDLTEEDLFTNQNVVKTLLDEVFAQAENQLGFVLEEDAISVSLSTTAKGRYMLEINELAEDDVPPNVREYFDSALGKFADMVGVSGFDPDCECPACTLARNSSTKGTTLTNIKDTNQKSAFRLGPVAYRLDDFEQFIQLGYAMQDYYEQSRLYHYQNKYYLVIEDFLSEEEYYSDMESIISEFGNLSNVTVSVLEEYGKVIYDDNALEKVVADFKLRAGA